MCVRARAHAVSALYHVVTGAFLCVRAHREHACTSAFPAGVTGGVYCEGGLAPLMALACPPYCRSDLPLALSLSPPAALTLSLSLSLSLYPPRSSPKAKETARARSPITSRSARIHARPRTHTSCRADYADENPSVPIMRSAFTR